MSLDDKAKDVFGTLVVQKRLARSDFFQILPRYVTEFMLAKYVDPDDPDPGVAKIKKVIKEHRPSRSDKSYVTDRLMRDGSYVLIDEIEVSVDLRYNTHWANIPVIEEKARIRREIPEKHPGLLYGGMWGSAKLLYTPEKSERHPVEIVAFEPFQAKATSLDPFTEARSQFSSDEWIDLMLRSVGYEPTRLPNRRVKLLVLARLLPLVEKNLNIVELGPRGTGKTFLLRNTSPHVFVVSGGKTTPANLFINLSNKQLGIIGSREVVFFDEIASTKFSGADTISILKDYMESGQFSRGTEKFTSGASIVFAGNLDIQYNGLHGLPDPKYPHLFDVLPIEIQDVALLDRVHGYIPGWEIPKITRGLLANGYGLLVDYLADIFNHLREISFQDAVLQLDFNDSFTQRDERAVSRLTSGFIKLVYPHGVFSTDELAELAAIAAEFRQRVHNQLSIMAPGEFKPKNLAFTGMPEYKPADFEQFENFRVRDDRANRKDLVGEVTGMVALVKGGNVIGGDILLVEASAIPSKSSGVRVTGIHGAALHHSVKTAYACVQDSSQELGIPKELIKSKLVHVHLVRIATPREGASAGLTFLLAIVSALTGWPVRAGLAVTGEVSLHGKVTGVDAIPEKIMGAYRRGRRLFIIPKENEGDLVNIPDNIRSEVKIISVDNARDALDAALKREQ